ncbi:MAG TPA: MFS transporter, partial [Desulfitobacteriaceae bacterium]|nr:MFS transporter [Desulfitobacteriaceae bacterium]
MEKNNRLSKNVIILGLVSFFNDLASEMVYPIVPVFLTAVLGAPVALVGLIEGIAESTASLLKVFSGWLSDRAQKRKIFAVYGYSFSTISKIIIGIALSWPLVLLGRFIDRFGKGIRTSARDALITESATPETMGKAFGFHRALDTAGAVFGPLAAILLIDYFGSNNLRPIFYIAFIPGALGVLLLLLLVKEKPVTAKINLPQFKLANLTPAYKTFLLVSAIFALGNSSDAFLILRAQSLGLSTTLTVLAYVVFNLVYSLLSYSAGALSDKIGARKILIWSFFLFALTYLLFGINQLTTWIWFLFALYGVYMAFTEGISKAYITQIASREVIATSFGAYQTIIGICTFFSSLIAGILWTWVNPGAPFIFGAILAIVSGLIFMLSGRNK